MTLPDVVTTERLRLPLITEIEAADMRAGRRDPLWHPDYPRPDDLDAIGFVRNGNPWGPRHIVRVFDGMVFGSIGFFGAPDDVQRPPEVELGYGLVSEARGHGVAGEAVTGLLVHLDDLGVRVRARVEPTNTPGLRLLARSGFTELRGSDGEGNLIMARPLP